MVWYAISRKLTLMMDIHFWKKSPSWLAHLILDLTSLFPLLYKPENATSLSFTESQSQFGALKITLVSLLYSPLSNSDIMLYEVALGELFLSFLPFPSQVYITWLIIDTSIAMTQKVQHCQLVVWLSPRYKENTTHIFWSGIQSRDMAKSCVRGLSVCNLRLVYIFSIVVK